MIYCHTLCLWCENCCIFLNAQKILNWKFNSTENYMDTIDGFHWIFEYSFGVIESSKWLKNQTKVLNILNFFQLRYLTPCYFYLKLEVTLNLKKEGWDWKSPVCSIDDKSEYFADHGNKFTLKCWKHLKVPFKV